MTEAQMQQIRDAAKQQANDILETETRRLAIIFACKFVMICLYL